MTRRPPAPSSRPALCGPRPRRLLFALLATASVARAQEMEPRIYSNAPVGMNFLIAGYARSRGGLSTTPESPLKDAELTVDSGFLAYVRALDLAGRSAKVEAVLPVAGLSGSAEVAGERVTRDITGLIDPLFRFSACLVGAPALRLPEYARYRQDLIVGASLQVSVPIGQYDPARLVNLGTNRWMIRPELGISKARGRLTLEAALAAAVFTTNPDYFGGRSREQDPLYSTRGNLLWSFRNGMWMSLNATLYGGGRTRLDGLEQDDEIRSSRLGATLTLPLDRRNSVKVHGSSGLAVRRGTDFDVAGIALQHRWGGGI